MKRLLPTNSRKTQAGRRRRRPVPPSLAGLVGLAARWVLRRMPALLGLAVRRMLRIMPTLLSLAVRWKVRTAADAWLWAALALAFAWAG